MANGFDGIITQLEQQKAAIDKALAALRDVNGTGAPTETKAAEAPARKGGMTPEGKERLVAALKKRWAAKKRAAKKVAVAAPMEVAPAATVRNHRLINVPKGRRRDGPRRTQAGRAKLLRWRLKPE